MKKILTFIMLLSFVFCTGGVEANASRFDKSADALSELGLFLGTGEVEYDGSPAYALDRGATRAEALVMLIRLLGEEKEAAAYNETCPFTDVPSTHWAFPYISYAYHKGYIFGVSDTEFRPNQEINTNMYISLLLRALGYDDKNGDFTYNTAIQKGEEIGLLINDSYCDGNFVFTRDDCVYTSFRALNTNIHGGEKLSEKLIANNIIDSSIWESMLPVLNSEDKQIKNAFLLNTPVKPNTPFLDGHLKIYSEYDSNNRMIRTIGEFYFNPMSCFWDYKYDESRRLIQSLKGDIGTFEDEVYVDIFPIDYLYKDNEVKIHEYQGTGLEYEGDSWEKCDYEDDEISILKYDSETAFLYTDSNSFYIPDIPGTTFNTLKVYTPENELQYICHIDSDGNMTDLYDEKNRPLQQNIYNDKKQLVKSIDYTYANNDISNPIYSGSSFSCDSITETNYIYDGDVLTAIEYPYDVFTFKYFGNGRLDRVFWQDEDGTTWTQTYVPYNDEGHVKRPRYKD